MDNLCIHILYSCAITLNRQLLYIRSCIIITMPIKSRHLYEIPLNTNQYQYFSMLINEEYGEEWIGNDRHWSVLIALGSITLFIGIGRHLALMRESCIVAVTNPGNLYASFEPAYRLHLPTGDAIICESYQIGHTEHPLCLKNSSGPFKVCSSLLWDVGVTLDEFLYMYRCVW